VPTVEDFRRPQWAKPAPLGYGQAADAAHFVAAPLLASASVALIGVIGADGEKFRWPGPALLALALASVTLIGSIQYGFHARADLYSAGDLEDWWGPEDLKDRKQALQERQRDDFERWKGTIDRAVVTYNLGITLLGAGVALCLAPPSTAPAMQAAFRWIACAAVAAATVAELAWTVLAPRPVISLPTLRRRRDT
jgi:hypothetical protein